MNGRLEKEMLIDKMMQRKLQTMPKVLTDYYYGLIGSGKSYRTAKAYMDVVIKFIKYTFGDNCSEDFYLHVTSGHINRYISSLRTKTSNGRTERTSDSYRGTSWSSLNSFFQFLIPEYATNNPVANTTRPKMRDNPKVTYLETDEIARVLNNVEKLANDRMRNRDLCLLKIGFATGLRISAIIQMNIEDLDLEHNQIKVTEKGDHDDYVMIGDNLKAQIMAWLEDREKYFDADNVDALFVSQMNSRLNARTAKNLMDKYTEGITDKKVTLHVMRHSCATNLYEKTGDIYLCAKQLHHKNVSTTQRYAELSRDRQKAAANILDGMI